MKDRFDLLVFDWDGTLFDSVGWIVECLQRAAADCSLPIPSEPAAKSVIGLGLMEAMEVLVPGTTPELAARVADCYRRHYTAKPVGPENLFDGIDAMLGTLRKRGYRLAVATGKARAGLDHALEATGMREFFHGTRCADETASKPHPEMLLQLMDELRAAPARTLMIGDTRHDLQMAANARVAAIGVGCGADELSRLAELNPLACLRHTRELLDFFD